VSCCFDLLGLQVGDKLVVRGDADPTQWGATG